MEIIAEFTEPVKKQNLKLVFLKVDEVSIPVFQRDISENLRKHLEMAIDKLGFLTPIVVAMKNGKYYVIDGRHRLEAVRSLGASEILAIVVDESFYYYILEFNTEKPPNIKEKAKQTYRLYQDLLEKMPEEIEENLFIYLKDPVLVTFGFAIEEIDTRFPAGFFEPLGSKIDHFLSLSLTDAAEERRNRAKTLCELNTVVNQKYAEFGWENALMKGEIVRKAMQKAFGTRVRSISEEFYKAINLVKKACEELTSEDFTR